MHYVTWEEKQTVLFGNISETKRKKKFVFYIPTYFPDYAGGFSYFSPVPA